MKISFIRKNNQKQKNRERGASLVEYGLLVALIAVVVISAVRSVGKNSEDIFVQMATEGFAAAGGVCDPAVSVCP